MSTDAEKLAQIAALCDGAAKHGFATVYVSSVRKILAAPRPAVSPASATLAPEEVAVVVRALRTAPGPFDVDGRTDWYRDTEALATRLKGSDS